MVRMPRGEPRSVPDPAGELYDMEMARIRAQREAEDRGFRSPLSMAQDALHGFQNAPKIQRPNTLESFIPVVGPAWEAAADLQAGNYRGAAFNAAMAVGDALPVGAIVKGTRAATRGIGLVTKKSMSAGATAKRIREAGLAGKGDEIHHPVQADAMEEQCQRVMQELDLESADLKTSERMSPTTDWRLLLQIDTDNDAGMMWGDTGMLYFWIREQDARVRDFSKVWMILQCY